MMAHGGRCSTRPYVKRFDLCSALLATHLFYYAAMFHNFVLHIGSTSPLCEAAHTEAAAPPPSSYDISGRHKQQEDRALLIAKAAKRDIVVAGHSLQMTNTSILVQWEKNGRQFLRLTLMNKTVQVPRLVNESLHPLRMGGSLSTMCMTAS